MHTEQGRQVRKRTSNREAEVKPWGLGAKAEVSIALQESENLMFGKQLRALLNYSTLTNRHGTDPYAWWCGRESS